jgi:DNA-binding XRE family transcriptional regulator
MRKGLIMPKFTKEDFRPAREWIEKLPAATLASVKSKAATNIRAIHLAEVRKALTLTQAKVAARAGLKQAEISRIEKNPASVQIKTLDRYITGLGGRLRLVADFPDGSHADIPLEHGKPVKSKANISIGDERVAETP